MKTPNRYLTAFFKAVQMTLKGEKPPEPRHRELLAWSRQMGALVDSVYAALDKSGMDKGRREQTRLRLDGREMSLETTLAALKYQATREFPSLLRHGGQMNLNGLHATNINNRYWVSQLRQQPELADAGVQTALAALAGHLDAVPPA